MEQLQPLSAFNPFAQLQKDVCDILNGSEVLSANGIKFFPENALDIDFQIKNSLQRQGLACVALTPSAKYLGHNGQMQAYELEDFTLQIAEYTPANRASNKAAVITGLDLANYCAELLAGPNSVVRHGDLVTKAIEQGEDSGLLVTKATFKTALATSQNPVIYVQFVTKEEMEAYVGDATVTLKSGSQVIGEFSANQRSDLSIELSGVSGQWGKITGNINAQTDLRDKLDEKASQGDLDDLNAKVPNAASEENQLADKAFVNSSINNFAAFYITRDLSGNSFQTFAQLAAATEFFNGGLSVLPTKNDYCVVLQDETKTTELGVDPTTRYVWQGEKFPDGQWEFQYVVNNTALTQAQVDAINSGVTKAIVDSRVVPSASHPGWASEAEHAEASDSALSADYATFAQRAGNATRADFAGQATRADHAHAATENDRDFTWQQLFDTKMPSFLSSCTPLSTFNQTLGDLSSIIHGI